MNAIARAALQRLCREIKWHKYAGCAPTGLHIQELIRRHDRILARWPNAYSG